MRITTRCCCGLALLLIVAGCTPDYPFDQPGTWHATGVNDANLRVMVANPGDLIAGANASGTLGAEAAPPVKRLLTGHRYPLPNLNASTIDVISGSPTPQGGDNAGQQ